MNALDKLILEHESHKRLLAAIETDQNRYFEFREELIHHVNMEEAIFYPNLLKVNELEQHVREAWEEHNLIMQLLQELDKLDIKDVAWKPKFEVLSKLLLMHIEVEENNLFPEIRRLASPEFLCDVGEQMEIQKDSVEPEEVLYPSIENSHKIS